MANFKPLNNYSLFILDRVIDRYKLNPPFLDIACGIGYLSEHLGKKGWGGKAIDFSSEAVEIAKKNLSPYKKITVEKKDAAVEKGQYKTILMFDLLEHIKDDQKFLKKVYSLLSPKGHLVIAVPSNPTEWRWDDEFYGHFRRYTETELRSKLIKASFKPIVCYDYTFPFFWFLRRAYLSIKSNSLGYKDIQSRTKESGYKYTWNIPFISNIFNNLTFIWLPIYFIQYTFFRKYTSSGSAIFVLSQK